MKLSRRCPSRKCVPRALRTELVICDTRDFGVGRRLNYENWNALREAGEHASQRPCDAEAADAQPAPDVATLNQVTQPSLTGDGQHAPALRFGDARAMALMAAVAVLFTKAYGRILGPGRATLDPRLPPDVTRNSPLALAWKQLTTQLGQFIAHGLAPA